MDIGRWVTAIDEGTHRYRWRASRRVRSTLSADSAWSGFLALSLALGAALFGGTVAARAWDSPSTVDADGLPAFIAVAGIALSAIASRFSRRTLRGLALVLVLLAVTAVIGCGRAQVRQDRQQEALGTVARLRAEVADLAGTPPSAELGRRLAAVDTRLDDEPPTEPLSLALARRDVARVVDAYRNTPATTKAATAAEAAYLDAVEDQSTPGAISLLDALPAGGRAAVVALPGVGDDFTMPPVGWVVLACLALAGYRSLEARIGRNELLLASVSQVGKPEDDVGHVEQFRTYLSRNVPEPGAVPGATSALAPVTDLLAAAPGTPATWVARIVTSLTAVFNTPRGVCVSFAVLEDGTDGDALVAVRVCPAGRGEQLQKTVHGDTLSEALRVGAYWAAAVLIDRSARVPEWMCWSPEAAESLATYYTYEDTRERPATESLAHAVAAAPRSGLLLVAMAHQRSLEGSLVDSFEHYLRAVTLYPRWPVARYRLAATACMLAADDAAMWRDADEGTKESVRAALACSGLDRGGCLATALAATCTGDNQRRALCAFAEHLLQPGRIVGWHVIVAGLLRATERSYWRTVIRSRQHVAFRTQFILMARSARQIARIRAGAPGDIAGDLVKTRKFGEVTWQFAYNLACAHAEAASHPRDAAHQDEQVRCALEALELAVTRPGGHQLTSTWLSHDPDLRILHGEPRFEHLRKRLPREGEDA